MKFCHIFFYLLAFLVFGCDSLATSDHLKEGYPTILKRITDEKQQALLEKYQNNNPYLCAAIDEYGLNDAEICIDREILRVEIQDDEEDRMIKMAEEFLERNREFTNVYDTGQLGIDRSHGRPGCLKCDGSEGDISTISWELNYKNQRYEGLEVKNTGLSVFLDSEKVYGVYGHWYKNIVIPPVDRLDYKEARHTLIGKELTYFDWTGKKTYTITKDSFGDYEDKVIFPYKTERGLELRVCLVVSAGIWHLYVDSTTGEFVHKVQLVDF